MQLNSGYKGEPSPSADVETTATNRSPGHAASSVTPGNAGVAAVCAAHPARSAGTERWGADVSACRLSSPATCKARVRPQQECFYTFRSSEGSHSISLLLPGGFQLCRCPNNRGSLLLTPPRSLPPGAGWSERPLASDTWTPQSAAPRPMVPGRPGHVSAEALLRGAELFSPPLFFQPDLGLTPGSIPNTWTSRTQTPGRREPGTQGHGLSSEGPSWAGVADMMPGGEAGGKVRAGLCHDKAQGPPRPRRPVRVHACGVAHCVCGACAVLRAVCVPSRGEKVLKDSEHRERFSETLRKGTCREGNYILLLIAASSPPGANKGFRGGSTFQQISHQPKC